MAELLEKVVSRDIDRRKFVKGAMVAAAAAALSANFVGCAPSEEEPSKGTSTIDDGPYHPVDLEEGGTWVAAACWHNCGGRCVNKVCVNNGVVVRQKTDDAREDSELYPQQRACVRGHAQQQQCFGADRLKYPMKRKHWEPLTGGDKSLRGRDEWERISWDEAISYIADEFKNIYDKYGPRSLLVPGGVFGGGGVLRVLCTMGGFAAFTDTASMGTYVMHTERLGIMPLDLGPGFGGQSINDRLDLVNAEWIVFQGCNPAWASGGSPMYYYYKAKEAGVQYVMISPSYNSTAQMLDARWIPVRTGTDTAFMLAVAYEMLKLDESKGDIIDWDFLNTYTVGFDGEHMPKDAKIDENFKDYINGVYDGIQKTAEWATDICGTPVEDIRWYAELLGKNNKVMLHHSFSFARNHDAEDVPQLYMTLGAMGGHFGKSGHCCGSTYHSGAANGGPRLTNPGDGGLPYVPNPIDDMIIAQTGWKSVKEKKYTNIGMFYGELHAAEKRDIDIHAIVYQDSASLQTSPDILGGIEVHRSVEFVLTSSTFLTTNAKYSDIVLPITTEWERPGSFATGNREALFVFNNVVDPLFEAKSDQEAGILLAEALGLDSKDVFPVDEKQQFINQLIGCTAVDQGGNPIPLVSITADDLAKLGGEGTPQDGIISLESFLADGVYNVERKAGDPFGYIAYEDFIKDPVGSKRETSASGKFEIYCQAKADLLDGFGFSDTFKPYPSYHTPVVGFETTFSDFDKKVKGKYPYNLYNPHYFRRSHSTFNNIPWLRESWSNPVYISTQDAADKGISTGDAVVVSNPFGKVLRSASVTDAMMPGMVGLPHGAWVELDDKEEYDLAGADNVLCGPIISGMGVSGYNNYNCNIEKYAGSPLVPDAEWPQRIVVL